MFEHRARSKPRSGNILGVAVVLGSVGANFAAGMTGGMAFVYDPKDELQHRMNPETVGYQRIKTKY